MLYNRVTFLPILALLAVIGIQPALADCTVPHVLANGQIADASAVMENFNTVANCVNGVDAQAVTTPGSATPGGVAVFSSPKSITSGTLTGDVSTANGSLTTTLAPTGVTAGTYINPTISIDSKGRITAASGDSTSGGSSSTFNYFNAYNLPIPAVDNFTVSADSSFGSNYGLQPAGLGVSLYGRNGGFSFAWADQAVAGGGTTGDFAVTGLIKLAALSNGNYAIGITLGDGTRRITWGFRNTQTWMSHNSGTNGNDGFWSYGGDVGAISSPTLFRIRKTGGTIYFEVALDGKNFDVISSESATAYLSANITTYGIGILPNGTYQRIVCYGLQGG
jgi:hypothetical protein